MHGLGVRVVQVRFRVTVGVHGRVRIGLRLGLKLGLGPVRGLLIGPQQPPVLISLQLLDRLDPLLQPVRVGVRHGALSQPIWGVRRRFVYSLGYKHRSKPVFKADTNSGTNPNLAITVILIDSWACPF